MWTDGVKFNVLLLLADTVLYMRTTAALSVNYPKKTHATCVAHVLYDFCRTTHMFHPNMHKILKDSKELMVLNADMVYIHANGNFLSQSITKVKRPQIFCQKQKKSTKVKIN
jgi:hypothetical protein